MTFIRIEVTPALDEQGEWEEFTWDLVPVVPAEATMHLQGDGLPKIGAFVPAGGILVGKIGKTKAFRADKVPTALELHGLEFGALNARFGSMWYDASCYATSETAGNVVEAYFETTESRPHAIVVIGKNSEIPSTNANGVGITTTPAHHA